MNYTFIIRTLKDKTGEAKESYQLKIEESDAAVLQGLARLLERQKSDFVIDMEENNDVIDFDDYV